MSRTRIQFLAGVGFLLVVLGVLIMTLHTPLNMVSPEAYDLRSDTGHDFRLMYSAAHALSLNHNPYDTHVFLQQALEDGAPRNKLLYHGQLSQPFVYPPIFAWFLIPLTLLGPAPALLLWRVLSILLVFWGSLGLAKAYVTATKTALLQSSLAQILLAAAIAVAPLTAYAVYWGNPIVIVYAAMGGWVYALCRNHVWWDRVAGILMSVSLLKPQLALPLAVIAVATLVRGEGMISRLRNIVIGFGASIAVFLVLDVLVTPPALLIAWPKAIVYLSRAIALQPDMPSLYGLAKYYVPFVARHRAVYIGITAIGGIATAVLFIRLRTTWQPLTLLGMLAIVWCFATPYSHGNDQLLLVPGGLALLMAYVAPASKTSAGNILATPYVHPLAFQGLRWLAMGTIAALWLGSLPLLLRFHGQPIPGVFVTVAPLLHIIAFTATAIFLAPLIARHRPDSGDFPHEVDEAPHVYADSAYATQMTTTGDSNT